MVQYTPINTKFKSSEIQILACNSSIDTHIYSSSNIGVHIFALQNQYIFIECENQTLL